MNITKLTPAYKSIIWGGRKLKNEYGKETELDPLAESWELAFHKDGKCTLPNGKTLEESVSEQELGENCNGFPFFPVLVKFIDARDRLSVQVHPSDEYALKQENDLGKTEMWYIADADEGAGIYLGFNREISKDEFKTAIENKTLTELLRFIPVKKGETYFIPSGTIHAICSGCLICEIQQNSNTTYRVYDYGRVDKNGKERELHIEKALDVTSLTPCKSTPLNIPTRNGVLLGISKFFTAAYTEINGTHSFEKDEKSFRCFTCLEGSGKIGETEICKGESVFVPANHQSFEVNGRLSAIITSVRRYFVDIHKDNDRLVGSVTNDLGETVLSVSRSLLNCSTEELQSELLDKCNLTPADIFNL